jgi:hypothetical protein
MPRRAERACRSFPFTRWARERQSQLQKLLKSFNCKELRRKTSTAHRNMAYQAYHEMPTLQP